MKTILVLIGTILSVSGLSLSQETTSVSTSARILGPIPDGTPQPPAEPKPEYRVSPADILETTTHEQEGRTITIQRIKPIDLPPPPQPSSANAAASEEFSQRLAEYRAAHPRSGILFLSATVYRSADHSPRTLVHYWPEGGKLISLWSSADFALLAGGIARFADSAGESHQLFMACGRVDTGRLSQIFASKGKIYHPPEIPDFPEGNATFRITGKAPTPEDLVPIQSLHDLYNNEHARLLTAWQGREQARIERETFVKANPPQPRDITLNYWRTEKPAAKGGSK